MGFSSAFNRIGHVGHALLALWSKALPAAVSCLSSLPGFVFLSRACVKVVSDFQ